MSNFVERLTSAIEAIEAQKGGQCDVVEATPLHAILRVTFPGINPKRRGGTEIVKVRLHNTSENTRRDKK